MQLSLFAIAILIMSPISVGVAIYLFWKEFHHEHDWVVKLPGTSEDMLECSECKKTKWVDHHPR